MVKKWVVAEKFPAEFASQFPEFDSIVLQLLYNRKIRTQREIDEFFNPDYGTDLHDPFLFSDMKEAVVRIFKGIKKGEKMVVHGDYDADGVCSTMVLISILRALGANADPHIPHREIEGYGLNEATVKDFAKHGVDLIITCDCGISNREQVAMAKKLGVEIIITDHHLPPENLPKAVAVIDPHCEPNYPFKGLAGVGVAFKLAQALIKSDQDTLKSDLEKEGFEKWLLDLVAIGTITDLMPLLGENRTLVKYGIFVLNKTRRIGLRKLIEIAGATFDPNKPLDTHNIGFQIGPRLNAAGRIDHASLAYRLLSTDSEEEAIGLAEKLDKTNQERQKMTENIIVDIKKRLGSEIKEKIIFEMDKSWSEGVVGLAAGKLSDEFYRPAFVMTEHEDGIKGSGRSIPEFNITKALAEIAPLLSRFGGHAQACGFSIDKKENFDKIKAALLAMAEKELAGKELVPKVNIDVEVNLEQINWDLFDVLEKFSPFGQGNPRPKYLSRGLKVEDIQTVGQSKDHLRLMASHKTTAIKKFIGFYCGEWCAKLERGDLIDVVFEVDVNEWNGNRELQLKIVDIRIACDTNTRMDANVANNANYDTDTQMNANIVKGEDRDGEINDATDEDGLIYKDLSYQISGILFEVHNDMGRYHNEQQVCDALEESFKKHNLKYEREKVLPPSFDGETKGRNRIDFLIEDKIIIEVKILRFAGKEEYYQCLRYLEALNLKLAILVNFRDKHLRPKRILNPKAKI